MTAGRVELRIRRLELDAAAVPSRAALCAAVEAELAVRLGLAPADRGGGGRRAVPADDAIAALGRRVALAVLRELDVREPVRSRPGAGERRP
ncbi:hypothetical protein ABZ621_32265 [Streptomyces sp. NPDC007863]|uniref:hypothetical protein n=1 Tax=Streptomyces sp. NPDC007863 TaxID=3154894 RepID=UPI0033F449AF